MIQRIDHLQSVPYSARPPLLFLSSSAPPCPSFVDNCPNSVEYCPSLSTLVHASSTIVHASSNDITLIMNGNAEIMVKALQDHVAKIRARPLAYAEDMLLEQFTTLRSKQETLEITVSNIQGQIKRLEDTTTENHHNLIMELKN